MRGLLTILLIAFVGVVGAENDYVQVDSLTYDAYLKGNWDDVISEGKTATDNGTDFKYLRQRMGYAYFMKGDYYNSLKYYSKASDFDKSDITTNLYLYYSSLYSGETALARYFAGFLPDSTTRFLGEKAFKPVSAVDAEYSYKWNNETGRSDPDYIRMGINTQLGYRLNLYQSVSKYKQSAVDTDALYEYRYDIIQNEYYALLSYSLSQNMAFDIGYHHTSTKYDYKTYDPSIDDIIYENDGLRFSGNMFLANLRYRIHRINMGFSGSVYKIDNDNIYQAGFSAGVGLPGVRLPYLYSSINMVSDNGGDRLVSSHSFGMFFFDKLWLEAKAGFDNHMNYAEMNGMYLYNSLDATSAKYGASAFYHINKRFNIYINYTSENKTNYFTLNDYIQQSVTTGLIIKL